MVTERLPIAVLVSGTGTNLQALLDTVHGHEAQVVAVASSRADAPALDRAADRGVATAVFARGDYADRGARDEAIGAWLQPSGARLVVLAGYMELLGDRLPLPLPRCRHKRPSLAAAGLPGAGAIEQALAYGVKVFGVTVHFVDAGVDTGAVISQRAIELPDAREPGRGAGGAAAAGALAAARGGAPVRARSARRRPGSNPRRIATGVAEG